MLYEYLKTEKRGVPRKEEVKTNFANSSSTNNRQLEVPRQQGVKTNFAVSSSTKKLQLAPLTTTTAEDVEVRVFKCAWCRSTLNSRSNLTYHVRTLHYHLLCLPQIGVTQPERPPSTHVRDDQLVSKIQQLGLPPIGVRITKSAFVSDFNTTTCLPNYVIAVLSPATIQQATSCTDRTTSSAWLQEGDHRLAGRQFTSVDFDDSGFQMGHCEPLRNMSTLEEKKQSYTMVNALPTPPEFNSGPVSTLEKHVADVALANKLVTVVTGPLFYDPPRYKTGLKKKNVPILAGIFKVLFIESWEGTNFSQAFVVDFKSKKDSILNYCSTLEEVEKETGFRFFTNILAQHKKSSWGTTKATQRVPAPHNLLCPQCPTRFTTHYRLRKHIASVHRPLQKCTFVVDGKECGAFVRHLDNHQYRMHNVRKGSIARFAGRKRAILNTTLPITPPSPLSSSSSSSTPTSSPKKQQRLHLDENNAKLEQQLLTANAKSVELEEKAIRAEQKVILLETKAAQSELQLDHYEARVSLLEDKADWVQHRLAIQQSQGAIFEEKLASSEQKLADYEAKLVCAEEKLTQAETKLISTEEQLDKSEEKNLTLEQSLAASKANAAWWEEKAQAADAESIKLKDQLQLEKTRNYNLAIYLRLALDAEEGKLKN